MLSVLCMEAPGDSHKNGRGYLWEILKREVSRSCFGGGGGLEIVLLLKGTIAETAHSLCHIFSAQSAKMYCKSSRC